MHQNLVLKGSFDAQSPIGADIPLKVENHTLAERFSWHLRRPDAEINLEIHEVMEFGWLEMSLAVQTT